MSLLPAQCRAARALLAWSQDDLSVAAKVAKATIANFEAGKRVPYDRTLLDVQAALETAGVEILNHGQPGARLKNTPSASDELEWLFKNPGEAAKHARQMMVLKSNLLWWDDEQLARFTKAVAQADAPDLQRLLSYLKTGLKR